MNKEVLEELRLMREQFGWDKSDTIEFMTHALQEEALELARSLDEGEEAFQKELADVLLYALAICADKGYDINQILLDKIAEIRQREY